MRTSLALKSNLILYTPRTGSTILGEMLSFSAGGLNLNEGLVDSVFNGPESLYNRELLTNPNLSIFLKSLRRHPGTDMTGSPIAYHSDKQERINILKNIDNWTIKEVTDPQFTNIDFIRYCCDLENVNVYMTFRRNIADQFLSYINMVVRGQSMFTNKTKVNSAIMPHLDERLLIGKTRFFMNNLIYWRLIYEMFKTKVTLVCYEDIIKPMNFTSIGIDDSVVKTYNMRDTHIIPTPSTIIDSNDPQIKVALNEVKRMEWIVKTL